MGFIARKKDSPMSLRVSLFSGVWSETKSYSLARASRLGTSLTWYSLAIQGAT